MRRSFFKISGILVFSIFFLYSSFAFSQAIDSVVCVDEYINSLSIFKDLSDLLNDESSLRDFEDNKLVEKLELCANKLLLLRNKEFPLGAVGPNESISKIKSIYDALLDKLNVAKGRIQQCWNRFAKVKSEKREIELMIPQIENELARISKLYPVVSFKLVKKILGSEDEYLCHELTPFEELSFALQGSEPHFDEKAKQFGKLFGFIGKDFVFKSKKYIPTCDRVLRLRLKYVGEGKFENIFGEIYTYPIYTEAPPDVEKREQELKMKKNKLEEKLKEIESKEGELLREVQIVLSDVRTLVEKLHQAFLCWESGYLKVLYKEVVFPIKGSLAFAEYMSEDPVCYWNNNISKLFLIYKLSSSIEFISPDPGKKIVKIRFKEPLSKKERKIIDTVLEKQKKRGIIASKEIEVKRLRFNRWETELELDFFLNGREETIRYNPFKKWDKYVIESVSFPDLKRKIVYVHENASASDTSTPSKTGKFVYILKPLTPSEIDLFQSYVLELSLPFLPEGDLKFFLKVSGARNFTREYSVSKTKVDFPISFSSLGEYDIKATLLLGNRELGQKAFKVSVRSIKGIPFIKIGKIYISSRALSPSDFGFKSKDIAWVKVNGMRIPIGTSEASTYQGAIYLVNRFSREVGLSSSYNRYFLKAGKGVSLPKEKDLLALRDKPTVKDKNLFEYVEGYYDYRGRALKPRFANLIPMVRSKSGLVEVKIHRIRDSLTRLVPINLIDKLPLFKFRLVIPEDLFLEDR